ncbi:MAG: hypothetical protein KBD53_11600 [Candidatus Omnitrophica bacterium]|nr:hypothetical protein [Candidatus Omnitrophota bacterium]
MKRIMILIFSICLCSSLPGWAEENVKENDVVKTYYKDGSLHEEFSNVKGLREGEYREFDPKGILLKEIDYDQGEIKEIRNYDEKRQTIIKIMEEKIDGKGPGLEKDNFQALHTCVSEVVGIRFACNPNWKLIRLEKMLKIQVSFVPKVEIIIEEDNLRLRFISDFSRRAIASLEKFEDNFDIQRVEHCSRETVSVTGYLKGDTDTKVHDLFMVDHHNLHSVEFTVKPKDSWIEYEELFQKVINSLEFTAHKTGVKFNLTPTNENCEDIVE